MVSGRERLRDSFGIALGLDLLAAAVAAQGDGERAAHAYGTGQAFWRMAGHPLRGTPELAPVREECERQAREAAGSPAYEDAFHRGLVDDGESGLARALRAICHRTTEQPYGTRESGRSRVGQARSHVTVWPCEPRSAGHPVGMTSTDVKPEDEPEPAARIASALVGQAAPRPCCRGRPALPRAAGST